MSEQSLVPWLLLAMVASISGMVVAAAGSDGTTHLLAASGFGLAMLVAALLVNMPYWRGTGDAPDAAVKAARRNARLHAFSYVWGGAAMAADYSLAPLRWRHDWQYALAMIVAALVCFSYAARLARPGATLAAPNMLRYAAMAGTGQGIGAAIGIAHLFISGKIWTFGGDWAANHIFLIGGAILIGLSTFGVQSYRRTTLAGAGAQIA